MNHSSNYFRARPMLRLANIMFLAFLLANLWMPPGWVHRTLVQQAMADPPPNTPLSENFVGDTWLAVHQTLYGPVEQDHQTVFYPTDSVIKGIGEYTGQNNVGQPFTLNIIRHYQYTAGSFSRELNEATLTAIAASGTQWGLFWGTMSTPTGSANVIGFSMGADPDPMLGSSGVATGIIPIVDHDVLMSVGPPTLPASDAGNFNFGWMSEPHSANMCEPGHSILCKTCPGGYV